MTTTTLTRLARERADRIGRVREVLTDTWPTTVFHIADHGLSGLTVIWTGGPTCPQVGRLVRGAAAAALQMRRRRGPAGTAITLQIMQSLEPWTSLTRFGRVARNRRLYLQDGLTYRDVFALDHTPATVADVMDAVFARLTLP